MNMTSSDALQRLQASHGSKLSGDAFITCAAWKMDDAGDDQSTQFDELGEK